MTDEPEIVKELRESEKLGRLQSKMQSAYEELDVVEEPSEDAPDKKIAFAENTAERITREDTTHYDVKTEKLYRSIVELSPDSIVTVDLKGVVTSCNSAGIKMMGYSRDELVGKHFTKIGIFRAKDNSKYLKLFVSVIKAKNFGPFEVEFRRKDGTTFLGEVRFTLLKEKGRPVGIMAIIRDITDCKQAEESLIESEEKFKKMGFDRVYPPEADLKLAIEDLWNDLRSRGEI